VESRIRGQLVRPVRRAERGNGQLERLYRASLRPYYNVLEERFELLLVNAQHLKAVPGRKTDVKDAEWIADLLRHGLVRPSFVPDREQRELRELVRYRTSLIQERTAAANRLHKILEGANIKLASVASDILGRSGREMLEALVAGDTDVTAMADLARGKMRDKRATLERALAGRFGPHQRFLVAEVLNSELWTLSSMSRFKV
jgi:transposase